jgi:hypothetical protein
MSLRKLGRLAVLMGDLVESRAGPATRRLHATFNTGIEAFNRAHEATLVSPLTITLGDEFQGLVTDLADGFTVMQGLRLHFLEAGVACRFVLGAAQIATDVNRERAWNMMGPGLAEARSRLNDKDDPSVYRFSLPDHPLLEASLNTHGYTLTYVEQQRTDTQRRYFLRMLRKADETNAAVAQALGISSRNLYNVLRAGHRDLYGRQLETIGTALAALDAATTSP